jgi:phage repressor protein C with HTH and peptisase S24 domain/transcriptional regulator with XRE-family HTH domain
MTDAADGRTLSERLKRLRESVFGPRGRAAFARAIDVSPSTYHYYEKGRQPPADLIRRAAEVTGADPDWLLTGRGEPFPDPADGAGDTTLSPSATDVLDRFARLMGGAVPGPARAAIAALVRDIEASAPPDVTLWQASTFSPGEQAIPILGRTAAGLPAEWDAWFAGDADADVLERLLARVEALPANRRAAAVAPPDPQVESAVPTDPTAELIQLAAPTPEGVAEFLRVPGLGHIAAGTFALRVDGDSMAPRIRDGDIVVARRDAPPHEGHTAVAKIRDHIGVTVKLWRTDGDRVHMVPINEACDPGVFPRDLLLWACRVLWLVRL